MKQKDRTALVQEQTQILRTGMFGTAIGIRRCLRDKDVDVEGGFVAEWFPDDNGLDFGVFVTGAGQIFQFDYDYLRKPETEGSFCAWEDLTATWRDTPYAEAINAAIEVAQAASGRSKQ